VKKKSGSKPVKSAAQNPTRGEKSDSQLFQMLCAPFLKFFGERPDILLPMRVMMLPLAVAGVWAPYKIGESLFSPRVGLWAALFTGFGPLFFFTSSEFRTDDLWVALWLLAVAVFVSGKLTPRRAL